MISFCTCSSELEFQNVLRNALARPRMRTLLTALTTIRYQVTSDMATRMKNKVWPTASLWLRKCSTPVDGAGVGFMGLVLYLKIVRQLGQGGHGHAVACERFETCPAGRVQRRVVQALMARGGIDARVLHRALRADAHQHDDPARLVMQTRKPGIGRDGARTVVLDVG